MSYHLFIGGPCDGQMINTDPQIPFWKIAIRPTSLATTPYPTEAEPCNEVQRTETYRRDLIGKRAVYVHEDMTRDEAIDMVLDGYKF